MHCIHQNSSLFYITLMHSNGLSPIYLKLTLPLIHITNTRNHTPTHRRTPVLTDVSQRGNWSNSKKVLFWKTPLININIYSRTIESCSLGKPQLPQMYVITVASEKAHFTNKGQRFKTASVEFILIIHIASFQTSQGFIFKTNVCEGVTENMRL